MRAIKIHEVDLERAAALAARLVRATDAPIIDARGHKRVPTASDVARMALVMGRGRLEELAERHRW